MVSWNQSVKDWDSTESDTFGKIKKTEPLSFYASIRILREEMSELDDALTSLDLNRDKHVLGPHPAKPESEGAAHVIQEMCDVIWTVIALAHHLGYDLEGAFAELVRANNSKTIDGKFLRNDVGKIMKGPNYSPPNMLPFVGKNINA